MFGQTRSAEYVCGNTNRCTYIYNGYSSASLTTYIRGQDNRLIFYSCVDRDFFF